jgi:hypothetical protein
MEHKFYDLEDKINIIYDYLYNVNTKNCFSIDKIELGRISIEFHFPSGNTRCDFLNVCAR